MLKQIMAGVVIVPLMVGVTAAGPAGDVLTPTLVSAAAAGPFDDGIVAYHIGDYTTAYRLWRPLAEQGDVVAQAMLGVMYHNGQGIQQNFVKAAKWHRVAAEQGEALSQLWLGMMYVRGVGILQDYVSAHMWLNLAAAQGRTKAAGGRAFVEARMTPDQIAEAERLAQEWLAAH